MSTFPVVRATDLEAHPLAHLIAAAFHDLPPARWLIPDPDERRRIFPEYFRLLITHGMAGGDVQTVADASAVAVWFDATVAVPAPPPDYDDRLAEVCGEWVERFRTFDRLLDRQHPRRPHHHLALLATRPDQQGAGRGTALLEYHHRHLDRYAIPAYVEASSARSRDLYLRLGYRPFGPPVRLPDGPALWPLWRRPELVPVEGPARSRAAPGLPTRGGRT